MSPPTAQSSAKYAFKGPSAPPASFPTASGLRIGIVHARWNAECIGPLIQGCIKSIKKAGVKDENIVIESVPGSWELPAGTSRLITAGQVQASSNVDDLMGASSLLADDGADAAEPASSAASRKPFDAVISIGVLIKGSTMHFEYIAESCCQGLMRVGLDTNTPVILGVLTCLTEEQALERSGIGKDSHNHGEDWGTAAVEMAEKSNRWAQGKVSTGGVKSFSS
ncbi:unnamed protein product [Parajaminaea phylloscopi]